MNEEKAKGPQTLIQLFVFLIKGFFKNIPRMIKRSLIIAAVVFLVHTYLVIFPNGGFAPGTNKTLDMILALRGKEVMGTMVWTIASFIVMSTISRLIHKGPGKFLGGIVKSPVKMVQSFFRAGEKKLFLLFLPTALALIFSVFVFKNYIISILLAIGLFLALSATSESLSYLIVRLGHSDFQRIFRKGKTPKVFKDEYFVLISTGLIAGMLLFTFMPYKPYSSYFLIALFVGISFALTFLKKGSSTATIFIISYININVLWFLATNTLADDGGVAEAGGITNWLGSQGAGTATMMGLPPAIGSGISGAIGWLCGQLDLPDIGMVPDELGESDGIDSEDLNQDEVADEEIDEITDNVIDEETGEGIMDELADILELVDQGLMDNLDESQIQFIDDFFDGLVETADEASVVWQDLIQISGEAAQSWMDYIEYLGQGSQAFTEVMTNPFMALIGNRADDFLNSSIVTEVFNAYDNLVPDWFEEGAELTANEAWNVMGNTIGLLDALEYTDVSNSDLGTFMSYAGIIKDFMQNVGDGDSLLQGGIKSVLANRIKDYLWELNPAVNMMDLFSYFAFDGSEAGNIISPSATVQGSTNLLLDTLNDYINGTNVVEGRIDGGKYGGFIKIVDETTELAADMVYNSDSITEDISNVVTDNQFYDDMYQTNEELWRPQQDAWIIKRGACYLGQTVTEGFIKIADGTAQLSSWLGELSTNIW